MALKDIPRYRLSQGISYHIWSRIYALGPPLVAQLYLECSENEYQDVWSFRDILGSLG